MSAKHDPPVHPVQKEISTRAQLSEISRALLDIRRALAPESYFFEILKSELQAFRREISADYHRELQRFVPKKRRLVDPRKVAVAEVILARPRATVADVCKEMDRLHERHPSLPKYYPVPEWNTRSWSEVRKSGKVKTYVSKIRKDSSYLLGDR